VIVIGRPLVIVAVEHYLYWVMMIVIFGMVTVFVESDGKNRHTSDRPQQ